MTPEAKAEQVVAEYTSNNFLHQSAKPTLLAQIVKVIELDRQETGLKILDLVIEDERIGVKTKDLIAEHVMGFLGIKRTELAQG